VSESVRNHSDRGRADRGDAGERQLLLCLSQSFTPDTTPTGIRAGKLLDGLSARYDVTVLTESAGARSAGGVRVEVVRGRRPVRLFALLRRLRLNKLLELFVWPDESIFWLLPAVRAGRRIIRERRPSAIVVFMMPYSAGLAGIALARLSGLPLVLNLDDSPTCTDMHPYFPTRLHYRLARALEDLYVRRADAIVYVSRTNLELVRARQPQELRDRFYLVRYGADPADFRSLPSRSEDFEIAYVGAMSGWWALIGETAPAGGLRGAYAAWNRLGRHEVTTLEDRTSSPAVIGRAILEAIAEHPDWDGRVGLTLYGNPYPADVVQRALRTAGVDSVVSVFDPVPHGEVTEILCRSDLLFITLPRRPDGSRGGRISAKTYEYLMTDRPILAAVSEGENRDYLLDKPGVWLVDPADEAGMREVIEELAAAKFAGRPSTFDREPLREELSYATCGDQFAAVVREAIARRGGVLPAQESNSSPR
jgi:glycosyltransferase involved in cell wall biosynthesis